MLVLGIGTYGRDSAAVLVDDGSLLFALEEEKIGRLSGAGGIPKRAMELALKQAGVQLPDISMVAIGRRLGVAWKREAAFRAKLSIYNPQAADWTRAIGRNFRELSQMRQLARSLGNSQITGFEHHLCHAASTFYTSEFDRALVLTLDECGDMWSGLISIGEGENIRPLHSLRFPNSLGWFYTRVTELLGLRPHRDEHKLQWLSLDGGLEYVPIFRKLFSRDSRGLPVLNRRYFGAGPDERGAFSTEFHRELGIEPKALASEPKIRASVASSAQSVLEELVLEIASRFCKKHDQQNLCLAGGLFYNVLTVRALETRGGFTGVYVQPVAGNAGTALGAALLGRKQLAGRVNRSTLPSLFLGPEFSSTEIKAVLDNCKILYSYFSEEKHLLSEACQLISNGKILAWFQGRTEFGHRALGNRSILASPFSEYVIENVNDHLKHRNAFHPFALSVPAEVGAGMFEATPNCKFMASLGSLRRECHELEPFLLNNKQMRIHTVERDTNLRFWNLLHTFGKYAPAPILVNTSFNLFGEPLVSDLREAIRSFYSAGIDALCIGNFMIVKG
jgi:carbamoyltransferase